MRGRAAAPAPRAPQLRANDEPKNERAPMLDRSVLSESRGRKGGSGRQRAAERGRSGQRRNTENAEYSMKFSASELAQQLSRRPRGLVMRSMPKKRAAAAAARQLRVALPP